MNQKEKIPHELKRKFQLIDYSIDSYYFTYKTDKLARLFLDTFHLSPLLSGIIGLGIILVFYLLAYLLLLFGDQDVAGLGINEIYIDFYYDIIMMTAIFYFYVWISNRAQEVFLSIQLAKSGTHEMSEYVNYYVRNRINHPLIVIISLIIAISLVAFIEYSSFSTESFLWGTDKANFWLFRIFKVPFIWGVGYYMAVIIFLKQIFIVWGMRTLCRRYVSTENSEDSSSQKVIPVIALHNSKFSILIGICGLGYLYLLTRGMIFDYLDEDILIRYSFLGYLLVTIYFYLFPLHPFLDTILALLKKREFTLAKKRLQVLYRPSVNFAIAFMIPLLGYFIF